MSSGRSPGMGSSLVATRQQHVRGITHRGNREERRRCWEKGIVSLTGKGKRGLWERRPAAAGQGAREESRAEQSRGASGSSAAPLATGMRPQDAFTPHLYRNTSGADTPPSSRPQRDLVAVACGGGVWASSC